MYDAMQHDDHMSSSPKENIVNYRWCMCNWWQFTLIPVVSSSGMTYANVFSVPAQEYNIHDIHHPTERYLPSYLFVGASFQKCKLHKVIAENKS
jgi:hypothetical protein